MRTDKYLKRMGYTRDQDGIVHRYEREYGGWDSHLMKCRQQILEYVSQQQATSIAILGSGWLLDVPLEEILAMGTRVVLVDIIQPPQIRHRLRREKRVRLVQADVTGGMVQAVYQAVVGKNAMLPLPEAYTYEPDFQVEGVVSLNILTQLDSLIADYLIRQNRYSPEELDKYREAIQKQHLAFLRKRNSLLITEYAEERNSGNKTGQSPLVYEMPEEESKIGSWTWEFDTGGNYHKGSDTCFHVGAFKFKNRE